MRYAEGPEVSVDVFIEAAPAAVWAVVADITTPARFSTEAQGAEWIEEGVRFRGHNHHDAIGDWTTECEVTALVPEREFAYAVGSAASPSASWRWSLAAEGAGTRLTQWMQIGPAPSGLSPAIEAMPDKEERIIDRRLAEHRANMQATVEGIKAMVEER